jgi:hypothetical protein
MAIATKIMDSKMPVAINIKPDASALNNKTGIATPIKNAITIAIANP